MEKKSQGKVVGLGEILWDVFPDRRVLGGAPANFAYHVSQFGLDGCAVSAVGEDEPGSEIIELLAEKSFDCQIEVVEHPTGTVGIQLDAAGIPSYLITENVAWDYIPFTSKTRCLAQKASAVCFGTLAQRCPVSRATIRRFVETMPDDSMKILDINLRGSFYDQQVVEESIRICNVLKINDEEIKVVAGMFGWTGNDEDIASRLLEQFGHDTVILTKGTSGSFVMGCGVESFLPTPEIEVADTVGAGDSFTAAFTAARLHGWNIPDAHKLAVDISAFVCSQHGAMPILPDSFRNLFR